MADQSTSMIWNGQGPVHMGTYDPVNGRPEMGFLTNIYSVGCGNRTLTATPSRDTSTLTESCSGQRLTLKEIETAKQLQVSISMIQFDSRTLARAFFGAAVETPGGTVTGEIVAPVAAGDYVFTKYPRISSVVVTDSDDPTPTALVKDTHYTEDDLDHGRLRITALPNGVVEPLQIDYEYEGFVNIAAFSRANVETGIIFSGVNGDGQKARVIIPRISLAMSGDFGWITDEASELQLSGQALYVPELQGDALFGPFMRIDTMPDLPVSP